MILYKVSKHRPPLHKHKVYARNKGAGLWSKISTSMKGVGALSAMAGFPEVGLPLTGAAYVGDVIAD